jgi:hypothetical protein
VFINQVRKYTILSDYFTTNSIKVPPHFFFCRRKRIPRNIKSVKGIRQLENLTLKLQSVEYHLYLFIFIVILKDPFCFKIKERKKIYITVNLFLFLLPFALQNMCKHYNQQVTTLILVQMQSIQAPAAPGLW